MSDAALQVSHIFKKFRRGEIFDSLRDLIPALAGKMFKLKGNDLEEREFWALRDVSFVVAPGEAFGIIGPNGAGKSTILKILSGIMRPGQGSVEVNGKLSALIEIGAGFHPDLTGRENIFLNGTILGMSQGEIKDKFDAIVDFAGLNDFIDTPVKRYSSGMYARLGFSIAAHVDPDVLIIDEVLSVGDYVFQEKCARRMKEVVQSGATVVFVSHNLHAIARLCRRSLLLHEGQVKAIGPTSDVIKSYMDMVAGGRTRATGQAAVVSAVTVRNKDGESVRFESGEKAWVDIEVEAGQRCEKLAVVLEFKDDKYYSIFDTSTERLGNESITLEAGERLLVTFELDINFAFGTFYLAAILYRYDVQKEIDAWSPATTIYVSTDEGVRGVVNCHPKVLQQKVVYSPDDR